MTKGAVEVLSSAGEAQRETALDGERLVIGRDGPGVDLACPEDDRMAPDHAHVVTTSGGFALEDRGDPSGVWIRLRGPEGRALREGDQLWLGGQLLQIVCGDAGWRLRHHGSDGRFRAAHGIPADGLFIGRTSDLPLDESDGLLSRRHAQVVHDGEALRFYDRGAHNGSYLRVVASEPLDDGDEFRVGANRFRLVVSREDAGADADGGETTDYGRDAAGGETTDYGRDAAGAETTDYGRDAAGAETTDYGRDAAGAETTDRGSGAERAVESGGSVDEPNAAHAPDGADLGRGLARAAGSGLAARLKKLGDREAPGSSARGGEVEDATRPRTTGAEVPEVPGVEPESPSTAPPGDESAPADAESGGPSQAERVVVVLEADEDSIRLEGAAGQTVLEIVQEAELERARFVDWECEDGGCGVCVLAVSEGADQFDPPDPETGEMKTIQITEQVAPDPKRYRLACLARVQGPVRLRKMT